MILYVRNMLAGNDFSALPLEQTAVCTALFVVPIWVLWQIFGFILQYKHSRKNDLQMSALLEQGKKNQDYTDLIIRAMLDAEHEIKDGFVINKFDIFIADLNELLADIVLRCNVASSIELEQLWNRVKNGERWVIGKTLVEASKRQDNFKDYIFQKATKDSIFKGTLYEFCARYQDLSALLEKHDRDRVFINIIETGVLGSVYALLAPVADSTEQNEVISTFVDEPEDTEEETSFSAAILNMPEPENDETPTFWQKINPFNKTEEKDIPVSANDQNDHAFFEALQNLNTHTETTTKDEDEVREPLLVAEDNYSKEEYLSAPEIKFFEEKPSEEPKLGFFEEKRQPEPELNKSEDTQEQKTNEDNLAYPFGGWLNEENFK